MNRLTIFLSVFPFLVTPHLLGQLLDLPNNTLNFKDVTQTNLVQTVTENPGLNEKDIDFADYDNDGDMDCVISVCRSDFGQRRNKLYRNDNGVMVEVSGAPVIPGFELTDNARSAFFRDFDGDGFADIVIVCDSNSGTNSNDAPGKTKFFRNVDGTHFVNESERLGGITGAAADATVADFDNNGLPDLVMVNEPNISQDALALNDFDGNGPGQLQVVTQTNFPSENYYGDNAEAADMNGDGQIDLLIANTSASPSFIYYNNNLSMGNGTGDFRYDSPGRSSSFDPAGASFMERSLFPGDFNNDGKTDFYFADRVLDDMLIKDAIMQNMGNDEFNRAVFKPLSLPNSTGTETMKIRSADLDQDGRVDLIVLSEFRRPQIFRNTSENGEISFLSWTPASLNDTHIGWQANAANLIADDRPDILVGALQNDFLFENQDSPQFQVSELTDNQLPDFHQDDAISVVGDIEIGHSLTLSSVNLPAGANVSVLLRSFGDTHLRVVQNETTIVDLDRAGHSSDEAVEFALPATGVVTFEISMNAISFDGNQDGIVNLLDVQPFIDCLTGISNECDPFDLDDDGNIELLLVQPFVDSVLQSRTSEQFVFEILSRED